jgi:hypothetical protein
VSDCVSIACVNSSLFYLLTVDVEVVYFHLITLRHTPQSVGLLWSPLADNTNTYKRQTSMPPVGFEPAIPASAWPQTYALDCVANDDDDDDDDDDVVYSNPLVYDFLLSQGTQ